MKKRNNLHRTLILVFLLTGLTETILANDHEFQHIDTWDMQDTAASVTDIQGFTWYDGHWYVTHRDQGEIGKYTQDFEFVEIVSQGYSYPRFLERHDGYFYFSESNEYIRKYDDNFNVVEQWDIDPIENQYDAMDTPQSSMNSYLLDIHYFDGVFNIVEYQSQVLQIELEENAEAQLIDVIDLGAEFSCDAYGIRRENGYTYVSDECDDFTRKYDDDWDYITEYDQSRYTRPGTLHPDYENDEWIIADIHSSTMNRLTADEELNQELETDFCNFRGPLNECVMNQTNQLQEQEYNVSSIFEARSNAVFEAFNGPATLSLDNTTRISGLWRGEISIESEQARLEAGASFRPENGRIVIGD